MKKVVKKLFSIMCLSLIIVGQSMVFCEDVDPPIKTIPNSECTYYKVVIEELLDK
ncbi:hypothetical protein [Acidaminobacter sp. JC074]|uniref:hypothetical protein n=1 Tax=Acidaminobacter sp. JC074 TaxID=2530199 RepID=UPI001F10BFCE|nr:hypothetical protein [Acidaminobacter sp. JC074]